MMRLTNKMYVPTLRWRQAEYQALFRPTDLVKDSVAPFVMIPNIEFDFEKKTPTKSIQDHVNLFVKRYRSKWANRWAWIGVDDDILLQSVDGDRDVFSFVFDELRSLGSTVVPVIPVSAEEATVESIADIVARDGRGSAISICLEDLMNPSLRTDLQNLVATLGAELEDTDLFIDLGAPNFEPYETFANVLISTLRKLDVTERFRNVALIGTSIPSTFREIRRGEDAIPRHDWLFYATFRTKLGGNLRQPTFGDYTIVHPKFRLSLDMRMIKPAGKVLYTTPKSWLVRKGGAFRDDPGQMHGHCADIVNGDFFMGAQYSHGDNFIALCADRKVGPSNQTRWKEVAINHHITHVVNELATSGDLT